MRLPRGGGSTMMRWSRSESSVIEEGLDSEGSARMCSRASLKIKGSHVA